MDAEHRHLGASRFPSDLSDFEIEVFFTLSPDELAIAKDRRGDVNRIGLALLFGMYRMAGRQLPVSNRVPEAVLSMICSGLDVPVIDIATVASLYQRRMTRHAHQKIVQEHLGLSEMGAGGQAGLVKYLNQQAIAELDPVILLQQARIWLRQSNYLQPGQREVRDIVSRVVAKREKRIFNALEASAPELDQWLPTLIEEVRPNVSRLEWLCSGPRRKSLAALEDQVAKISLLRALGAGRFDLAGLPDAGQLRYAGRVRLTRASKLARLADPARTISIACFLEHQLRLQTDSAIDLFNHIVNDLVRRARDRGIERAARKASSVARLIGDIRVIASDDSLSGEEMGVKILSLIEPFEVPGAVVTSRTQAMREELSADIGELRRLLNIFDFIDLNVPDDHPLAEARAMIAAIDPLTGDLPEEAQNPFGKAWTIHIDHPDRRRAFTSWCAATALLVKRSLRNGSASISHSKSWQDPDKHMIPSTLWERDRGRFQRNLIREKSSEAFLKRIETGLAGSLSDLANAAETGAIRIEGDTFSVPREEPEALDSQIVETRRRLIAAIGQKQLPEVIIGIDRISKFSTTLLGRAPRSDREQVVLYAAILALGSDLEAADMERMIPGVTAAATGVMMRRLETSGRLREANNLLAGLIADQAISSHWGGGGSASSDMMSLDAARTLWSARSDPRRRTASMGAYTHVADHWAHIYDQPIVLNQRQAGAAIEGALRQDVADLDKLAIDTHGITHFSMALAKLLGFDLCPRLARLTERKLYVFRDTKVPAVLEPITSRTLSRRSVALGWDGLLRVAASTQGGWCSAVWAVDRHSSASAGMKIYHAGETLGKLLRSSFLCDYLSNGDFRTEIQRLLNQNEGSHRLQRAIHNGPIRSRKGRTREQMLAITGALTLLTNIVIAWNTIEFERAMTTQLSDRPMDHIRNIAPIAHGHINMQGIYTFDLKTADVHLSEGGRGTKNERDTA